jgi:hypothetical protein
VIPIAAAMPAADHADKIAALGIVVASLEKLWRPRHGESVQSTDDGCYEGVLRPPEFEPTLSSTLPRTRLVPYSSMHNNISGR